MKTRFAALLLTGLVVTGGGCAGAGVELPSEDTVVIFHNGTGPMCIEALDWLAAMQSEHPGLVVEQRLTTDLNSLLLLEQMKTQYGQSQGVSTTFGYLPLIFFRGHAFSARKLMRDGAGRMYCLAGVGGRVSGILLSTQAAESILAIDGCPLACAKNTLEKAGIARFQHVQLADLGMAKGKSPVNEERIARAAAAGIAALGNAQPRT